MTRHGPLRGDEKPWSRIEAEMGLLVKVVPAQPINSGTHDRCGTTVEPMVKPQWFVKMDEMAKPAIEALKSGKLRFVPESFGKHISTGSRESAIGVSPDSSGGATGSRLTTAKSAVR